MRLLPYWLLKRAFERINREGLAAVLYLHPWDLDAEQPIIDPTPRERFTHYYNLDTTEEKLTTLLHDFRFLPLIDLINEPEFQVGGSHD
jgi:hypothetical protein